MRWILAGTLTLALTLLPLRAIAQAQTAIRIAAPASGETLSGLVQVMGTSAADGFASAELSFAYASDPTSTWFLIYQTASPVTDGLLVAWDTTLVTDGDYHLRLRVILQDDSILESLVTGLRVRNQLPTETLVPTSTPEPTATTEFIPPPTSLPPTPQPAPTSTRLPTPTPLPPNPATVSESQIYVFLFRVILITLLAFLVVFLILRFRRN